MYCKKLAVRAPVVGARGLSDAIFIRGLHSEERPEEETSLVKLGHLTFQYPNRRNLARSNGSEIDIIGLRGASSTVRYGGSARTSRSIFSSAGSRRKRPGSIVRRGPRRSHFDRPRSGLSPSLSRTGPRTAEVKTARRGDRATVTVSGSLSVE